MGMLSVVVVMVMVMVAVVVAVVVAVAAVDAAVATKDNDTAHNLTHVYICRPTEIGIGRQCLWV